MAVAGSYYEWIRRPDHRKIGLADINLASKSSTGTPETRAVYFATEYFVPPPGTVTEYDGLLKSLPTYERGIQEVFAGRAFPSFGPMKLYNDKGTLDKPFTQEFTKDQRVTLRLGGPPDRDWETFE